MTDVRVCLLSAKPTMTAYVHDSAFTPGQRKGYACGYGEIQIANSKAKTGRWGACCGFRGVKAGGVSQRI